MGLIVGIDTEVVIEKDPTRLHLEITETMLLHLTEAVPCHDADLDRAWRSIVRR